MRVMKDQRKKDTFFHTAFVLPVSTNICNSKHLIGFGFIDPRHFEASFWALHRVCRVSIFKVNETFS